MEKCTKFGISAAVISMVGYFLGYYSIYYTLILWIAVLALCSSIEAKKNVTQALVFAVFVQIAEFICDRISGWYLSAVNALLKTEINYKVIEVLQKLDLFGGIAKLISLATLVLMIIFVIVSLKGKKVKIPGVTKLVDKAFE